MIKATAALLEDIISIGWQAANKILALYQESITFSNNADGSPLTQADLASHQLITKKLQLLVPDAVIISEENTGLENIPWKNHHQFWLVDPLDGTKEFINHNGEFTINIALIEAGQPILGIVCAPALNILYAGLKDHGAFKMDRLGVKIPITVMNTALEGLHVVGSRSHGDKAAMDTYLAKQTIASFTSIGSSLKFCLIAEGRAHLYPRLGRTMEWDTAAGHAVLAAAGGEVIRLDGELLYYGKKGFENPHFIAKPCSLLLD